MAVFNLTRIRVRSREGSLGRTCRKPPVKWFWSEIWRVSDSYTTKCSWQTSWRALLARTVVGGGSQPKRTCVAGAQRDATKISATKRFWGLSREYSTPPWLEKNMHNRIQIKLKIIIGAPHNLEEYTAQVRGFALYSIGNEKAL